MLEFCLKSLLLLPFSKIRSDPYSDPKFLEKSDPKKIILDPLKIGSEGMVPTILVSQL